MARSHCEPEPRRMKNRDSGRMGGHGRPPLAANRLSTNLQAIEFGNNLVTGLAMPAQRQYNAHLGRNSVLLRENPYFLRHCNAFPMPPRNTENWIQNPASLTRY